MLLKIEIDEPNDKNIFAYDTSFESATSIYKINPLTWLTFLYF